MCRDADDIQSHLSITLQHAGLLSHSSGYWTFTLFWFQKVCVQYHVITSVNVTVSTWACSLTYRSFSVPTPVRFHY